MTTLDPNLLDFAPECAPGMAFPVALPLSGASLQFNVPCLSAMSGICGTKMSQGINALLLPTSNCFYFRQFLETLSQNIPLAYENNRQYLDPLKARWCATNTSLAECACLNAINDTGLGGQCVANASQCPGELLACNGTSFSKEYKGETFNGRSIGEPSSALFTNISFDRCLPYYCWADVCWSSDVFKPFSAINSQTVGCGNACISVVAENTISIRGQSSFDNLAPIQTVFPQCNKSSGAPDIYYIPQTWKSSVNLVTQYVANVQCVGNGESGFLTLVGSTSDDLGQYWLEYPQTLSDLIQIPPGGVKSFTFTVNTVQLQAAYSQKLGISDPSTGISQVNVCDTTIHGNSCQYYIQESYIKSPSFDFEYTYVDANRMLTTRTLNVYAHMILFPPSTTLVENYVPKKSLNPTHFPQWSRYTLIISLAIFVLCYLIKELLNHFALHAVPNTLPDY
jgi:hypothetical protein